MWIAANVSMTVLRTGAWTNRSSPHCVVICAKRDLANHSCKKSQKYCNASDQNSNDNRRGRKVGPVIWWRHTVPFWPRMLLFSSCQKVELKLVIISFPRVVLQINEINGEALCVIVTDSSSVECYSMIRCFTFGFGLRIPYADMGRGCGGVSNSMVFCMSFQPQSTRGNEGWREMWETTWSNVSFGAVRRYALARYIIAAVCKCM